jgi:hypothetical protein
VRSLIIAASLLLVAAPAAAQQVVQQPVVATTSISTTVSVPDRGRVLMGGISSAQSARQQYGPLPSGVTRGFSRQATSITTSVYIHDLQAMDEELLNSSPTAGTDLSKAGTDQFVRSRAPKPTTDPATSPREKATKFEQLALKADAAGKPNVARLHWQVAAKYGSQLAETRLAELTQISSSTGRPVESP